MNSSTRVALNTAVQYIRTIISVIITLYTSRIVLENLGVEDYGIYSLIGGVVALLAFIQNNLSRTMQRYLSYFQGKNDNLMLTKIFNNSIISQGFISIILCGLLFSLTDSVFAYVNIPLDRIEAAKWVYWIMIVSLFLDLQSAPYLATLIAHENIVYSSIIQIADAILKIPIAFSLIWISENKLEWYSLFSSLIIFLNLMCYYTYCKLKYKECNQFTVKSFDFKLIKEMISFMGWSVYGTMCVVGRTQGVAILLNKYFGTAINAAFGISGQLSGQVSFLASALVTAISPQIIKSEGAGDRKRMFRLSEISCKFSFLLMSVVSIPLLFYLPTILQLWLGEVPQYTVMFCFFIILSNQIDLFTLNLNTTNQAVGNVKLYSICINSIKIITLPIVFLVLQEGGSPTDAMWVYIIFEAICAISRLFFLHINVHLSITSYIQNVFLMILPPIIINIVVCYLITPFLPGLLFLVTGFVSVIVTSLTTYWFGLKDDERIIIEGITKKIKV